MRAPAHCYFYVVYFNFLRDKIIECREKTLRVDFGTSLIPRDANDTAVLSLDLMEEEFVAVRCSANGTCLYNSISLLIKGLCFKACCS